LRWCAEDGDDSVPYFSLVLSLFQGLEESEKDPIVTGKGGDGEVDGQGGNCMPESALLLQGVFDKTREPEGHPFYFLSCRFFSFLDECAIRVFSRSGALRRLLLRGLGIMGQELAKGHRTFSSAMGVPTGRLGEKTVSKRLLEILLQKRLNFHTGPCHQFR
jgi:hypothetical protein